MEIHIMASPKQKLERLLEVLNPWKDLASTKSFGGMTLEQFEAKIKPSLDTRQQVTQIENQLAQAITLRDDADEVSLEAVEQVVYGVVGDPTEGPDSALYEAPAK
jgi:hypothetical protein